MKKLFSLGIMFLLLLTVQGCTKTEIENDIEEVQVQEERVLLNNEDMEAQEDTLQMLNEIMGEQNRNQTAPLVDTTSKKDGSDAIGSCDAIDESSSCIEYYGSFWTEVSAKLQCSEEGTFSTDPCPRDFAGGCNTGMGTEADMVVWMYTRGGGEMTVESIKYAKMACDATMASHWIE